MEIIIFKTKKAWERSPMIELEIDDLPFGKHEIRILKKRRQGILFKEFAETLQRISIYIVQCRECRAKKGVTMYTRTCQTCGKG